MPALNRIIAIGHDPEDARKEGDRCLVPTAEGRPPVRHRLKGTHGPERQLAVNLAHDAALATWFHGFLDGWIGLAKIRLAETRMEAAE